MMKKYVLPTLVSLTLSSSWVLAEENPTAESPASAPPVVTQPPAPVKDHYQEMREKRATYMQEMQALREKLRQAATDQEEWQRLRNEMQRLTNDMRQQLQEMREKMWKEGGMMHRRPYGPPQGNYGPGWGGPSHYGPRGGYYGRPFDRRGGMPEMPRPDYRMPYGSRGGMPEMPKPDDSVPYEEHRGMPSPFGKEPSFVKKMPLGHHAKMIQHLENIEKLLEQLVEQSKSKN